jgi:hypothetical protein
MRGFHGTNAPAMSAWISLANRARYLPCDRNSFDGRAETIEPLARL